VAVWTGFWALSTGSVAGWIVFWSLAIGSVVGLILLFRSFRRWRQPPAATTEQRQAEMRLYEESHQTDRW
jgi:membrane protein implicated in regulation of membrane protease activity